MNKDHFELITLGGGSGGIASAVQAAKLGKKVAIIEKYELGGTCLNRGCIPKKIMWYASNLSEILKYDISNYGFNIKFNTNEFDWFNLKEKRDNYIKNIHNFYIDLFKKLNITQFNNWGKFKNNQTIILDNGTELTGDHIFISPGSYPSIPNNIKGYNLGITSDDFFKLNKIPKKVLVVGGGYIGIEIASILNAHNTDTTLIIRKNKPLINFDHDISNTLVECMNIHNLKLLNNTNITKIEKNNNYNLTIFTDTNKIINNIDTLIWATGRSPNTNNLGIENTDIRILHNGIIPINEWQETNVKNIYCLGDASGNPQLTPVAITCGRKLAIRLFTKKKDIKPNLTYIPTVIFSHPSIATIGLTEKESIKKYGYQNIKVYKSKFISLYYSISKRKIPTFIKLIVIGKNEKIVGCHMIGLNVDEILQGFAVAINMGATKQDFDDTIAIHPTIAEELVTLK